MPRPPQGVRADVAQTTAVLPPEDTRGSNEQAGSGRRRPVPQSPGTGVAATGRPGASRRPGPSLVRDGHVLVGLQAHVEDDGGPAGERAAAAVWPLPQGGGRVGMASEPPLAWSSSALVPDRAPARVRGTGSLAPPATARTRRPAGCDAPGLLRQVGAAAMRPPLGSRATGSRRGDGGPLSAVGLPARLVVPRGSPRVPWRGPQPTGLPVCPGRMVPPLVHSPSSPASRGPALTGRPQRLGDGTHARHARSPERVRACTAPAGLPSGGPRVR
jgi:hypothetical protein